ncbi:MAG TPA: sigma-70 family RNA polymerase sigma factor [Acidimicrobiales bacterium]|nr:sigma-70 family RNA polymerase sigma factor [Acidimicrobiales bacterium]
MAMTSLDERLLVEAHNGGDAGAFASIVNEYSPSLYAHAVMRLGESRAAEDAVQETFLRAYRAMPRFEGEFHLRAWLHRILTNVCFDEGNRRRRETRTLDRMASFADPVVPAPDEVLDLDRAAAQREVATALAALPDAYREALELRYVEQLSFREVADVTGVTEENARARVHRGRAALRRLMNAPYAFAALFIPALRKGERAAQAAMSNGGTDAASSMSSIAQSAPTFTRLAVELSGPLSAKAGILAGVVAAAATTVAVPVASSVADHTFTPPPPAVAVPARGSTAAPLAAPEHTTVVVDPATASTPVAAAPAPSDATQASDDTTAAPTDATSTPVDQPQTFSAPQSAAASAAATPASAPAATPTGSSTDTSGPAVTPAAPVAPVAPVTQPTSLLAPNVTATAAADSIELTGTASFGGVQVLSGMIGGTFAITPGVTPDDPVRLDGTLTFTAADGSVQTLRLALRAVASTDANGLTSYAVSAGRYELTDASGNTTTGALTGSLLVGNGNASSISLTLS